MNSIFRLKFMAVLFGASLAAGGTPRLASQEPDKTHQEKHHQDVAEKGDHVMGFSHEKSTHHFRLYSDGGAIEVTANDAGDAPTREAIQGHFSHIVKMFAAGDFTAPVLIHSQNPPGSEVMKRLRSKIDYRLTNTASGARIRITTQNPEALKAIHAFLRFQIAEHQTGDTAEVTKEL